MLCSCRCAGRRGRVGACCRGRVGGALLMVRRCRGRVGEMPSVVVVVVVAGSRFFSVYPRPAQSFSFTYSRSLQQFVSSPSVFF